MKNYLVKTLFSFCLRLFSCVLLCFGFCYGQSVPNNSQSQAANIAIAKFNSSIGRQSWLYYGPGYDLGKRVIQGNPNFLDTTVMDNKGWVVYNGYRYKDVPLLYNINKEVLVTELYDGTTRYALMGDKLSEFNIFNHHFIKLNPDTATRRTLKAGFYEEAYKGKLQVLVKYTKIIHVVKALMSPEDNYEAKTFYYLKKSGLYHTVASEGDMLDLLQDRKKELKKYIKDYDIKFKSDPAYAMAMLATYYDQLTN